VSRPAPPARRPLVAASLALSVVTAALVGVGNAGTLAFLAWLASLAAGLAAVRRTGQKQRLTRRDWLALVFVALAGSSACTASARSPAVRG
jgi:hypothetical protein